MGGPSPSGQSPAGNPLMGAWKVDGAQAGLYIFTKAHYSFARVQGDKPLPEYPSNDKATDADKVAVFNALYLNTGTYTVTATASGCTSAASTTDVVVNANPSCAITPSSASICGGTQQFFRASSRSR